MLFTSLLPFPTFVGKCFIHKIVLEFFLMLWKFGVGFLFCWYLEICKSWFWKRWSFHFWDLCRWCLSKLENKRTFKLLVLTDSSFVSLLGRVLLTLWCFKTCDIVYVMNRPFLPLMSVANGDNYQFYGIEQTWKPRNFWLELWYVGIMGFLLFRNLSIFMPCKSPQGQVLWELGPTWLHLAVLSFL